MVGEISGVWGIKFGMRIFEGGGGDVWCEGFGLKIKNKIKKNRIILRLNNLYRWGGSLLRCLLEGSW